MNLKRNFVLLAVSMLVVSIFMTSGCSLPATGSTDSNASRATGIALNSLASYVTYQGTDVMLPIVHWYFKINTTAPAGYRYKLVLSYWADWHNPGTPDRRYNVGTYTCTNLSQFSVTKLFPSNTGAFWETGRVVAYLVKISNGAQTLLVPSQGN